MKTVFKIIALTILTFNVTAQTSYNKSMKEAFKTWESQKINETSKSFEAIAKNEKDNWLPYYYAALVNVSRTFYSNDRKKIPAQLVKAKENLALAKKYAPNNVENLVLEALILTSEMLQDTEKKSKFLAPKIEALYQKAITIAPENPRAVGGYSDWRYNSALYLKQDTSTHCDNLKKALVLLENEKQSYPFAPKWGKERIQMLLKKCN